MENRKDATQRGYNYEWKLFSKRFLLANPSCARCGKPAQVVDHKAMTAAQMLDQFGHFVLDEEYYQPLCIRCNSLKGAREDKVSDRRYFKAKAEFEAGLTRKDDDIGIV